MMWPWKSTEKRNDSYTDALVSLLQQGAGGGTGASVAATGALEASCSLISRCFASAQVSGPAHAVQVLGPDVLAQVGRALIRSGEAVYFMDVQAGRLLLLPAQSWDIFGSAHPDSWTYRLTLAGPDAMTTVDRVQAAGVLHFRYATDPSRPFRGVAPLTSASLAGRLSAETTKALGDELSGPTGSLLPIGSDGGDPSVTALKGDIRNLRGSVALVEKLADWASGGAAQGGASEWQPRRIGAAPPPGVVEVARQAFLEVLGCCGVPPSLFLSSADGTAQRESFRRFLHTTLQPLTRVVEAELSEKLDGDVTLNLDSLFASDLAGRARAFTSLVTGGMEVGKAASLAGLMEAE